MMHKGPIKRAYERFLDLQVAVVLAILWLAGVALIGLCALVLYLSWLLLSTVAGP